MHQVHQAGVKGREVEWTGVDTSVKPTSTGKRRQVYCRTHVDMPILAHHDVYLFTTYNFRPASHSLPISLSLSLSGCSTQHYLPSRNGLFGVVAW